METDNRKGNFVDYTLRTWQNFFRKSMCSKEEDIRESDADLVVVIVT